MEMLMNMFGGLGTASNRSNGIAASFNLCDNVLSFFFFFGECLVWCFNLLNFFVVPPEELYATQLTQLQEMGFFDTQENLRALIATNGNVHAAVERLLGNLG